MRQEMLVPKKYTDAKRTAWKLIYVQFRYVIPLLLLLFGNVLQPKAQAASFWTEQKRIPDIPDFTQEPPFLIVDQNNTVHAFNSQPLVEGDEVSPETIFYRRWTEEGGWTSPIDIFYLEGGAGIQILGATSDSTGVVSLIYQQNFGVYFTSTFLVNAGNSTNWSPPILLAGKSTGVSTGFEGIGAIGSDGNGNILVIYSGSEFGKGLYSVNSSDSGNNWTKPYPVYLTGDESMVVTDPALFVGASGKFHAVWATYESTGAAGPGYYGQFGPTTKTWTEPMSLDVPGIRTPSVIEYGENVIVGYYHSNVNGNWWRLSNDGGTTWSVPSQISPIHLGTNGRVSFVVDSDNILYGFFGERINDLNHGMWQVTWTGYNWTEATAVVKGPQIVDLTGGGRGFDPRSARAVISNGNLILVTWTTDGFAGENGAWYSYKKVAAPELPSIPNFDPRTAIQILPTDTLKELVVLQPTKTPIPSDILYSRQPSRFLMNPQMPIVAGMLLAFLLVVGILFYQVWFRSSDGR